MIKDSPNPQAQSVLKRAMVWSECFEATLAIEE